LGKYFALKIKHSLRKISRSTQIGFKKGHFIFEGMEWAHCSSFDGLFIKIAFKKVNKRVDWFFILSMLKALGLCPFSRAYKTLFYEALTCLSINMNK
jgi:hypothetical protein